MIEQNDTGAAGNRGAGKHDPGRLIMAAIAVVYTGLLYWLRAANQTPDGLSYALAVRSGLEMFHPHHMIYVPVARWIHLVTGIDPISATLCQNLFWTVVLGLAAWRLAGLIFTSRSASIVAACALLATRGVMIYSVRVETYLPAMACLVLATSLAAERPVRTWLLVPSVALAILYHQTNVLFVLPLFVLLCCRCVGKENSGRWLRTALVLARSAALVVGIYVVGFKYDSPPVGFWDFVLSYARAPIEAWGSFGYYSPGGILSLAGSQARMILPVPEATLFIGGSIMLGALIFLVVWHIVRLRRKASHRLLRLFGLVFLAAYLPFFLWWMPSDVDFFLVTLLPLWLLVLILVDDLPAAIRSTRQVAAMVLVLAVGNLVFTIWPMHRDPGPGRTLALALDQTAPVEVHFITGYAVQQEMLYFTDRTRVHEGDGFARAVLSGEAPWHRAGDPVVVDGLYLRNLLARPDPEAEKFLRWLLGFDTEDSSCWTFRTMTPADGLLLGPPRRSAASWTSVEAEIKGLYQP